MNTVPEDFSEPFAVEGETTDKEPTALCKLFYLGSILMGLVAGARSKPISFWGYKFMGFFLLLTLY